MGTRKFAASLALTILFAAAAAFADDKKKAADPPPPPPSSLPLPPIDQNAAGGIGPVLPVPGTDGRMVIIPGITPSGQPSVGVGLRFPF